MWIYGGNKFFINTRKFDSTKAQVDFFFWFLIKNGLELFGDKITL